VDINNPSQKFKLTFLFIFFWHEDRNVDLLLFLPVSRLVVVLWLVMMIFWVVIRFWVVGPWLRSTLVFIFIINIISNLIIFFFIIIIVCVVVIVVITVWWLGVIVVNSCNVFVIILYWPDVTWRPADVIVRRWFEVVCRYKIFVMSINVALKVTKHVWVKSL